MNANGTGFHIDVRPVSISLKCPHCGTQITIPWSEVDEPECWGDYWGEVECPICHEDVVLGDFEYD